MDIYEANDLISHEFMGLYSIQAVGIGNACISIFCINEPSEEEKKLISDKISDQFPIKYESTGGPITLFYIVI